MSICPMTFFHRKFLSASARPSAVSAGGRLARAIPPVILSAIVGCLLLGAILPGCGQKDKVARSEGTKVLILGVDGVDMLILERLMERGEVPTFERLISEGSSGLLRSLEPILSPLIWTSMATGKTPDKHGILDFLVKDPSTGKLVPVTSKMRRVRALWNIAGAQDREVAFVGWLATWPAEKVNGTIVSDRVSYHSAYISDESHTRLCNPASIIATVDSIAEEVGSVDHATMTRFVDITEEELQEAKAASFDISNPINNLRLIYITSEIYRHLGLKILRDDRPDLMAVYFEETDSVGHLFVPYEPPLMPGVSEEDMRKYGGAMDAAYRHIDGLLGEFLEAAGDDYCVIIVSDHGFKTGASRPQSAPGPREPGAARWHRLQGVIMMWGPHIKPGVAIQGASVLDLAPTVLALLGLPVAEDMDGRPITEAMTESFLEANPVKTVETYEIEGKKPYDLAGDTPGEETGESEVDEDMLEKLRALGYLGPASQGDEEKAEEASDPEKLASWHSNEGVALLREGRYGEAKEAFQQAIASDPSSPSAHNNLGLAQMELREPADAEMSFKRALSLDPGYVKAHVNLAVLYDRAGRDSLAVREYRRALEIEPSKASVHGALGTFYAKRGLFQEALPHMRRANEIEPHSAKLRRDYGAVCWSTGDMHEAAKQFEEAVSLEPNSVESRLLLAKALMALGRNPEARQQLEKCLSIDPENREARALLRR